MKGASILIAEDEMIISMEMAGTLQRLGYVINGQVVNGEDAVAVARKAHPNLVMMDIRLHGKMDGIDAANIIRTELGIPVIFLTAHSDEITLQRAVSIQPSAFLIKPFRDRELYSAIELALHRQSLVTWFGSERDEKSDTLPPIQDLMVPALIINGGFRIRSMNAALSDLIGRSADLLLGSSLDTLIQAPRVPVETPDISCLHTTSGDQIPVRVTFRPLGPGESGDQEYLCLVSPVT